VNYAQALAFLNALPQPKHWKLERMKRLLSEARITPKFKAIHVTGTNGKGSVSAMLYAILRASGKKTAFYSSPHLVDWRERIEVDGKKISESEAVRILKKLLPVIEGMRKRGNCPSFFEVTTAIAFEFFNLKRVEWAVVEVGLGGRLDATNVLQAKHAIITRVAVEHAEHLGETIEKIAREKAAILKPLAVVVTGCENEALGVVRKQSAKTKSKLLVLNENFSFDNVRASKEKTVFDFYGSVALQSLETRLLGSFQAHNAALAVAMALELGLPESAIRIGLLNAKWPVRLQIISRNPLVVLDGAHNPDGVQALVASFSEIFGVQPVLVVGVMKDKDWKKMAREFSLLAPQAVVCTQAQNPRALQPKILAKEFSKYAEKKKLFVAKSVATAVGLAKKKAKGKAIILVSGSLFVCGEALALLRARRI